MKIHVRYFALLREEAGTALETFETTASTVEELWMEVCKCHPFSIEQSLVRPARNDEFCSWNDGLEAGDTIALLPPVSGG